VTSRIEDYALLSDTESAALVGRDGSIDWLTFPRFDSAACFAALLGTPEHGRWLLAPAGGIQRVERRYRPGGLVLETIFHTGDGVVAVIDCMPIRGDQRLDLVRLVEGRSGRVPMHMHLTARMDYGSIVPWVRQVDGGLAMVAGPDALLLRTSVQLHGEDYSTAANFTVGDGEQVPFQMSWHLSHQPAPPPLKVSEAIDTTEAWWAAWSSQCGPLHGWDDAVKQSLVVLKGLTYAPSGGIVAAATTSLPEALGGRRNWDYRYCWLRDATFSLLALMGAGFTDEARAWRDWLLRAVAGQPDAAQIMYGPTGRHRLTELEIDWLPGYEGSRPVRVGNAAHAQFQLDVFGEVLDALHQARVLGIELQSSHASWDLERALVEVVADNWQKPDDGIWEVRGGRQPFTHSRIMAWVAIDRSIRSAEQFGLDAPLAQWRVLREAIHEDVLAKGVDQRGVFVQAYGGTALDASLLLVPMVGFLPATDERVVRTLDAIQQELTVDGFVRRYIPDQTNDGLTGNEGVFLMCSFWLVDNLALVGRHDEARALFERLLALRNDVGLLSEQYDPTARRMLGNFPQAFSHVALITSAATLSKGSSAAVPFRARRH
jgi:GH15 family glucan-1,4-alpha-glucosidase